MPLKLFDPYTSSKIATRQPVDRYIFSRGQDRVITMVIRCLWSLLFEPSGPKTQKKNRTCDVDQACQRSEKSNLSSGFSKGGMGSPDDLHRKLINFAVVFQS